MTKLDVGRKTYEHARQRAIDMGFVPWPEWWELSELGRFGWVERTMHDVSAFELRISTVFA